MISHDEHIATIELVAKGLRDLLPEVSFVGGATVSLYIDEEGIDPKLRSTEDIDCVIEIATYKEFSELEVKLRSLGFANCQESGSPICRFVYRGIQVDIMPSEGSVLKFSNQWYKAGLINSEKINLPSGKEIRIFSFPYFFAAKTEAFKDRGKGDFYGSRDLEDLLAVLTGRKKIREDIYNLPPEIKEFLRNSFEKVLEDADFLQSIEGHLNSYPNSEARAREVLDILKSM